jgi:phosphatidate phosphatase APP1
VHKLKQHFPFAELPLEFTLELNNQEVEETEEATFTCKLSKPNQTVTWKINGKPIKASDKYTIECQDDTYTLIIKDCQLDDTADVSIVTKDGKSAAHLIVTGR